MSGVSVSRRVCDPKSQLFVILVWRGDRGEELGAGAEEELAKDGKGLVTEAVAGGKKSTSDDTANETDRCDVVISPSTLQYSQLVAVVLLDDAHNAFVGRTRRQRGADGQKSVHPLTLLGNLRKEAKSELESANTVWHPFWCTLTEPYW
jgi:hypothetical protein